MTPEEVEVKVLREVESGYAAAEDGGYVALLDTRLTPELVNEGLAREVIRRIQDMRKKADFNISDTIHISFAASDKVAEAVEQFADYIRSETLGETLVKAEPSNGFYREEFEIDGENLLLGVKRA